MIRMNEIITYLTNIFRFDKIFIILELLKKKVAEKKLCKKNV